MKSVKLLEFRFKLGLVNNRKAAGRSLLTAGLLFGSTFFYAGHADAQLNCMGDLSVGNVQGTGSPDDLNCTSGDVAIAETEVLSGPIRCTEGDIVTVELAADLQSSSNRTRSDIGIWLAEDGGDAISGSCQHFYFDTDELDDLDDALVDDTCGDIGAGELFPSVPLDTPSNELTVICRDGDLDDPENLPDGNLDVGSCIAWKVPGEDEACDLNDEFALGTLPANKAKCNCGNISIPIIVDQEAYVEVIKELDPDVGTFDLLINGVVEAESIGDGGTTTRIKVPAGTATSPGAVVSVSEQGNLGLYDSVLDCKYRDTIDSVDIGIGAMTSGSFKIQPDDDIVCTFTNELRKGYLKVVKVVDDTYGAPANCSDFAYSISGQDSSVSWNNTCESELYEYPVNTMLSVTEDPPTLADYEDPRYEGCTDIVIEANTTKICTVYNDQKKPPYLKLVKVVENVNGAPKTPNAADYDLMAGEIVYASGDNKQVAPGMYNLEEMLKEGSDPDFSLWYDLDRIYCGSPSSASVSSVTVDYGEEKTCYFVNKDNNYDPPGYLIVKKKVNNTYDGDAMCTDFNFTVSDSTISNVGWDDTCMSERYEFAAGTQIASVVENNPADGYTVRYEGCVNIAIESAVTKTCTVYNDQEEPPALYPSRTLGYWKTHPKAAAVHGSVTICEGTDLERTYATTSKQYCQLWNKKGKRGRFLKQAGAAALNCLEWGCPQDVQDAINSCDYNQAEYLDRYNNGVEYGLSLHGVEQPEGHGPAQPSYCQGI